MMSKQSGTKTTRESALSRCMKAPLRMLSHACDAYVRGMNSCAGKVDRTAAMGFPSIVPRSYSFQSSSDSSSSGSDDLRELIRAASVARGSASPAKGAGRAVPRSQSVSVGRIDEDMPCDFADDVKVGSGLLVPRSKSCGVRQMRRSVKAI